jgi:N6-L-threonylcarbamoyladenine synthase
MMGKPGCDFSFSGLKAALARTVTNLGPLDGAAVADLAAAFQDRAAATLAARTANAIVAFRTRWPAGDTLPVAGGVAANAEIRARLNRLASEHGLKIVAPPPRLCTDNAAMIAAAAWPRLLAGDFADSTLNASPQLRLGSAPVG